MGFGIATLFSRSVARSVAATSRAIGEIVSEDIAGLAQTLNRLADGDLTARFTSNRGALKIPGNDEIGALIGTYNRLAGALTEIAAKYVAATDSLRVLISGVALTSKPLAAASDEASGAAKQSAAAVDQIAHAVGIVAAGAQDQAAQIADTATAVEELSRTAEQIAMVAGHLVRIDRADDGRAEAEAAPRRHRCALRAKRDAQYHGARSVGRRRERNGSGH
jgi:methyl-accepting chemotaxis protein